MKLLFDNNLSQKLISRLSDLYPDSSQVSKLGLSSASDLEVWFRAKRDGYCLVTKDADFNDLVAAKGFPPKVIWIRLGNCTTDDIVELLRTQHNTIVEFLENDDAGILELG